MDIASSHVVLSFMNDSSSYNQIKMALKDETLATFRTPMDAFYYKVVPFGFKNVGATYQQAMMSIFKKLIHH